MSRITGPKCRLCRREGTKLFLRGDRCESAKCGFTRREYPPGVHTWRRGKMSEHGMRWRETQKVKRFYGVAERQFRRYFAEAYRAENTGEALLLAFERRLDNVVCLAGFADSRADARQIVVHGHVAIGGKRVDRPGYQVESGDVVGPYERQASRNLLRVRAEKNKSRPVPQWLEVVKEGDVPKVKVLHMPAREEISVVVREQMIVEFCSR